jgi:hypothetical protein
MRRILQACIMVVAIGACLAIPLSFSFHDQVPRTPVHIFMDAIHDMDGGNRLTAAQLKILQSAIDAGFVAQREERMSQARFEVKIWAVVAALALFNFWILRNSNRPNK